MATSHTIATEVRDGHELRTLASGELAASFAPGLGMVGCSLRHAGDELLGLGGGLAAYAQRGATFGIPLLHPWANRLAGFAYRAAGREVRLDERSPQLHLDAGGLPIHGLLAASPAWEVAAAEADMDAARLRARLDFGAHPELLAAFPFPHVLELVATVRDGTLALETALTATGDVAVPVSFGWHPYLRLPGVPRGEWVVGMPVGERLLLDGRMIPTGAREPVSIPTAPLGERTYDDGFAALADPATFTLAGGGRRIAVTFDARYPFAQVYAPPGQDFICFEPMTTPTNALVTSGAELPLVPPGGRFSATFEISVDAGG